MASVISIYKCSLHKNRELKPRLDALCSKVDNNGKSWIYTIDSKREVEFFRTVHAHFIPYDVFMNLRSDSI
jgi:hypothetical protein